MMTNHFPLAKVELSKTFNQRVNKQLHNNNNKDDKDDSNNKDSDSDNNNNKDDDDVVVNHHQLRLETLTRLEALVCFFSRCFF